jgi:hypothetical protein
MMVTSPFDAYTLFWVNDHPNMKDKLELCKQYYPNGNIFLLTDYLELNEKYSNPNVSEKIETKCQCNTNVENYILTFNSQGQPEYFCSVDCIIKSN